MSTHSERPATILALDLATKTGWAAMAPGWLAPERGVQEFALGRGESPGMRFIRFRAWLEALATYLNPRLVVFEQTHMRGGAATEIAIGFSTRVQEIAASLGAEHAAVHTATLKKHATGNGRADKAAMTEAAERRWGLRPQDDNEADALAVLAYAIDSYGWGGAGT